MLRRHVVLARCYTTSLKQLLRHCRRKSLQRISSRSCSSSAKNLTAGLKLKKFERRCLMSSTELADFDRLSTPQPQAGMGLQTQGVSPRAFTAITACPVVVNRGFDH